MIEDSSIDFERKSFLMDASMCFVEWLSEERQIYEPEHAEMFLQNYGLPTDLFDFTPRASRSRRLILFSLGGFDQ